MANGDRFTPSAVASLAVTAADATNPRIDIVYVSSLGVVTYLAGTAAATPSAPSVPAGGQKIAEINVAAEVTTIVAANIVDKRRFLGRGEKIYPTLINSYSAVSGYPVWYRVDDWGVVRFGGRLTGGSAGTLAFVIISALRPGSNRTLVAAQTTVGTTITVASDGGFVVNTATTSNFASIDNVSYAL
jgi:hypothetical protein